MARQQRLACRRSLCLHGLAPGGVGMREGEGEVQGARWLANGVEGLLLGGSSSPIGGLEWRG
jgi:hypothetical protein